MTAGPLMLVALVALVAGSVLGRWLPRTWLVVTGIGTLAALGAALGVLCGGAEWEWRSRFALGGEPLHLRLDALSAFFLVPVAVVGAAGAVYAREYWPDREYPTSAPRGRAWWSALVLGMGMVLTVSNGLHFLIVWEIFALSAYFLITLESARREVRAAGWLYLATSHAGTLCLVGFFTTLAVRTGTWDLGPMREHHHLAPFFLLALAGFGMKAGFFPLHIWLPSAHATAPSHVSAIMSGVAIKMGIYGIVRFSGWLPTPAPAGWVIIALGAASTLLGSTFSLVQNDCKRLLAYCSVENIGIILIGLGGAMVATAQGNAPWGRLALAGALLHVWNHGAFKALLFFGAGSVLHATGTREMSRLGGLWQRMPWTACLFALGSIAVSGLPPLNGFVSEWLVYLGLFDAVTTEKLFQPSGSWAWGALPAVIALAMAGALTLAAFAKAGAMVFLGAPRTKPATQAHECGGWMRGPMLALAAACVAIGLVPTLVWPAVSRAVAVWYPTWAVAEAPAPLSVLGSIHVALAALGVTAGALLWRKARANGLRRGPTWDCGYVAPTARMQYTSGSFAGLAAGWAGWILRPIRRLRRPRGYFPTAAMRLERVPEPVLERLLIPVGGMIMYVSTAVRRLQHGRLSAYILYVVVGLVGLGVVVLMGGRP